MYLEESDFDRIADTEDDRRARHLLTLFAIQRLIDSRRRRAPCPAPVMATQEESATFREAMASVVPLVVASCPTALAVRASNDEKRSLGLPVKGDPKIRTPEVFAKRPYTVADARADRDRWLDNARKLGGR